MRTEWKLRILYFLVFSCTASWLPIFADFLKGRGLGGISIGFVLSVPPIMMFLVQPFYGMLADRFGYKLCLTWSSFLASVTYVLYLFNGTITYILVITILMSIFYNSLQPLLDSLSLRLTKEHSGTSYGTLRIAGAAGWACTGITVGHFIDSKSTTVIFAFAAASMLLMFFVSFTLNDDSIAQLRNNTSSFSHVREVFGDKTLLLLLLFVFLISVGATTIWNFYSIYMKENGASASLVGIGLSFQGLCELPLFYFSARIIGRIGLKSSLVITAFATAVRLLLYSVVKDPRYAILIELLQGISWSLFWVVCVEGVNRLVREDWRVTGQSLLYAAYFGIGQIAGNFWTGSLYESKMKVSEIFLLNAGLVAVVAFAMAVFIKRDRLEGKATNS